MGWLTEVGISSEAGVELAAGRPNGWLGLIDARQRRWGRRSARRATRCSSAILVERDAAVHVSGEVPSCGDPCRSSVRSCVSDRTSNSDGTTSRLLTAGWASYLAQLTAASAQHTINGAAVQKRVRGLEPQGPPEVSGVLGVQYTCSSNTIVVVGVLP